MTDTGESGIIAYMKRVPVTEEQHRRAKAKAAEMGLTLERFVGGIIDDATNRRAEDLIDVVTGRARDAQSAGSRAPY